MLLPIPRVKPSRNSSDRFVELYELDLECDPPCDKDAVQRLYDGYLELYKSGDLDAGANLARIIVIAYLNAKLRGRKTDKPPEYMYEILDDLARNDHPAGPVLEIIARIFGYGAGKQGLDDMRALAAEDNTLAAEFLDLTLEIFRKVRGEDEEAEYDRGID